MKKFTTAKDGGSRCDGAGDATTVKKFTTNVPLPVLTSLRHVVLIGSGGAGKSTFARRLGKITGLEVIHLDAHYWKPGWVETPINVWTEMQRNLIQRDRWIMDGNYGATLSLRLDAADAILFFDYPRNLCARRLLLRWWKYRGRNRPDMGEGCPERFEWDFLRWVWRYPKDKRPDLLVKLAAYSETKCVIVLQNPAAAESLLNDWKKTICHLSR